MRQIAEENKLVTAKRKDSQGICFLGKINYNDFIEKYLGTKTGDIVEIESKKKIGEHKGYWFHTIGQRKGLGLSGGPWYVVQKDVERNIVFVSKNQNYFSKKITRFSINTPHWLTFDYTSSCEECPSGLDIRFVNKIKFKIRHSPDFTDGRIKCEDGKWWIEIENNSLGGIAPGQFCTIYSRDASVCLGSAEII